MYLMKARVVIALISLVLLLVACGPFCTSTNPSTKCVPDGMGGCTIRALIASNNIPIANYNCSCGQFSFCTKISPENTK